MKVTMVIPSYWARESSIGWQAGDAVYDHPTPLDEEGTLGRAIKSTEILEDKDFQLVVLAVATCADIEKQVEEKVARIIEASKPAGLEVLLFGPAKLKQIYKILLGGGKKDYIDLLQLHGYSNVRNMCMFVPHVLGAEVAVLIDDDELFEDPKFMHKAKEFIGKTVGGKAIDAVAGYYLQENGEYRLDKPFRPWMKYWDQYERMNEGFDKIIGSGPRLKETPFVFGGNMVIHRKLFTVVPFDPHVPRGEDIDFLINAKMFGFDFFLDNQLSIKHLAPPKTHPTWRRLREDIYRFVFERAKIVRQKEAGGITRVHSDDFDPYPGCFLKDDLDEKISRACELLALEYLAAGEQQAAKAALQNISISQTDAPPIFDPFLNLCKLQTRWQVMMEYTGEKDISSNMQDAVTNPDNS